MSTTRRDFFLFLIGAGLAGSAAAEKRTIRLGLLLPLDSGVQLGLEEAQKTAELVGAQLEPLSQGSGVAAVTAAVARLADKDLAVPLLTVGLVEEGTPVQPRLFHVASSPRRRREALATASQSVRVVDWHPDLRRYGAEQLNRRFEERFGTGMTEDAWRGWLAVKIATEAALRNPDADLATVFPTMRIDGHKGEALRFNPEDHHLDQPVYLVNPNGSLSPLLPSREKGSGDEGGGGAGRR